MSIVNGATIDTNEIRQVLSSFRPIGLKEMDDVHLMGRFDAKYVFHLSKLKSYLDRLKDDYRVLTINDLPIFGYENLYFDSSDLKSYHDHHNGRSSRYKVRFRKYSDSGKCYFEIKLKTNRGRTEKERLSSNGFRKELTEADIQFLKKHIGSELTPLLPQITNSFSRITLVNEEIRERVTLDIRLHFKNGKSERQLDDLVIAEVKQEHPFYHSSFRKMMQEERIFPTSISKYCLGTLLTHPGIKYNRFKPKLTVLNKICNGAARHDLY
jgi:hypothetical protein